MSMVQLAILYSLQRYRLVDAFSLHPKSKPMQIHNSQWILSGSMFKYEIEIVFCSNGQLEFIENGERLGMNNAWKRIDQRIEFSVCNPLTQVRHAHFIGRIYENLIKGACYKITGEVGSFEAVLIGSAQRPVTEQQLVFNATNISFFLANSLNLN